jgi:hypothetical protein
METILRYRVVEALNVDDLTRQVQQRLSDGWQPLGGPFYFNGSICQALGSTESDEQRLSPVSGDGPHGAVSDLELIRELTEDDDPITSVEDAPRFGQTGRIPR